MIFLRTDGVWDTVLKLAERSWICDVEDGSAHEPSPAITSEAAYEAAAARFNEISETIGPRRKALERELVALEAEWEAAQAGLRAHELKPGIPLWPTMPGGPRYQGSPE
jgi:hypothetical protein